MTARPRRRGPSPDPRHTRAPRPLPPPLPPPSDPAEAARFLRPQPPVPVPLRSASGHVPGLTAYGLMGGLVVKSGGYTV